MGPDNKNGKKFNVALYVSLILLVIAAVACGFFAYRFINANSKIKSQWQSAYAQRATPLPTSKVTAAPEPTEEVKEETQKPETAEESQTAGETDKAAETETATPTPTETPTPEPTEEPVPMMSTEGVISGNACLIRSSDGAVLLDKDADARVYPASMTKVMTAIIAIENAASLDDRVMVYSEDIDEAYLAEASMAGFEANEEVTVRDLLYGALLPSGAEACEALSTYAAESKAAFVEMMNAKAAELGLVNTHFTNVTGLHDDDEYTTCREMAMLFDYAMKNADFREIISRDVYTCTPTETYPEGLTVASTLFGNMGMTTFTNGAVLEGGKTGTTDEAGQCLVSAAVFYGEEYILCTAQAPLDSNGNFADAVTVYSQLTR